MFTNIPLRVVCGMNERKKWELKAASMRAEKEILHSSNFLSFIAINGSDYLEHRHYFVDSSFTGADVYEMCTHAKHFPAMKET